MLSIVCWATCGALNDNQFMRDILTIEAFKAAEDIHHQETFMLNKKIEKLQSKNDKLEFALGKLKAKLKRLKP